MLLSCGQKIYWRHPLHLLIFLLHSSELSYIPYHKVFSFSLSLYIYAERSISQTFGSVSILPNWNTSFSLPEFDKNNYWMTLIDHTVLYQLYCLLKKMFLKNVFCSNGISKEEKIFFDNLWFFQVSFLHNHMSNIWFLNFKF